MAMETLYGLTVLLFLIGTVIYVRLRIRGLEVQNAALIQRAIGAEQDLQRVVQALSTPERERVIRELTRSRPMPNPPGGLAPTLQRLRQHTTDPYAFALGWEITQGNPDVGFLSLANDSPFRSGNIAITGEPGHGKGNAGLAYLLALANSTTTSQLRIQILDPKVSDGSLWTGRAHLWREPVLGDDVASIQAMMRALREERQQRDQLRAKHKVREWEELPLEVRPPLLVVWITELATIAKAVERCDDWLERELSQCRSSGIRYILDLQNQSGKEMAWRSQIGTFIAGFQSSSHHIRPNIGMSSEEIVQLGGMLPTELKVGQFTVRNKRDVLTVTVPYLSTEDLRAALAALPAAEVPVAPTVEASSATPAGVAEVREAPPVDDLPISPELWTRIASVARDLQLKDSNATRADVYRIVFADGDPKAKPSGDNYKRIRRVCDTEGLLLPKTASSLSNGALTVEKIAHTA